MASFSLTLEAPQDAAEPLSAALFELSASGVEIRDDTLAPMPGSPQPRAGRALLVAWFDNRELAESAAVELGRGGEVALVPDEDWSETWKKGLAPFAIGRIRVRPSWVGAAPSAGPEVVLDPGMAFGAGTHPTTALCLAAVDAALAARPGASLLDVGTGSGLLAIAAKKLGAGRVVATDNDPVALRVARENAERNQVSLELTASPPGGMGTGTFDIVVANILANTLVELAPGIAPRVAPGGLLLLSGILRSQEEEVRAAYLALGLAVSPDEEGRQGECSLLALRKEA